jgi:hypothetical protein
MVIAELSLFCISRTIVLLMGWLITKQGPKSYYAKLSSIPGFHASPNKKKSYFGPVIISS